VSLLYLLDSNILSEPMRPQPNPDVIAMLDEHGDAIAMSSISWHEMLFGVERMSIGKRRTRIEDYLLNLLGPSLPILPYDERAAAWHASERARLVGQGLHSSFADGQIASIAATNSLILVTRNIKDFKNYSGLLIENWFEPSTDESE
tara:strand:+ start:498 stop:938 length:441 start_codon:yes stop_codon:yes gene_type:complete